MGIDQKESCLYLLKQSANISEAYIKKKKQHNLWTVILERPNIQRIVSTHTSALLLQISQGFYFFFQYTWIFFNFIKEKRNSSFICTLAYTYKRQRVLCAFLKEGKKTFLYADCCWCACICAGFKGQHLQCKIWGFLFFKQWLAPQMSFQTLSHSNSEQRHNFTMQFLFVKTTKVTFSSHGCP